MVLGPNGTVHGFLVARYYFVAYFSMVSFWEVFSIFEWISLVA